MFISDLHIHSRFSRATSKEGDPEHLELWARKKGIHILGTGDFTHPAWREELKEKLEPAEDGLYRLKKEYQIQDKTTPDHIEPRFVVTGEISSIYKKGDKTRKVHSLLILPGLEEADMLAARLETIGNIHSDGRPILGLDCKDLLEIMLETTPEGIYVPAHIWTPHFAMFGAFSGFDSVEECFEDLTGYIHAVETGLSSDPAMNWRVSNLDRYQLISNSDAHSPGKLGREANLMDMELSYQGLEQAVQTGEGLYGTIEFFPEEGKYHYDGHRKCHLCLNPAQTQAYGGRCPVCGKKITIGVEHRVEALADRPEGYVRPQAKAYESLIPLPEIIAEVTGHSSSSVKVQRQYEEMLCGLGTEFEILREVPEEEIQKQAGTMMAEAIRRLRNGEVQRIPGFDGEYGTIMLFEPSELEETQGQISFFDTLGIQEKQEQKSGRQEPVFANKPIDAEEVSEAPVSKKKPELNIGQKQAVESIESVTAVIAGPGTGKTKTLISKILYLLNYRKVKPSEITAVTFTNKAAKEMQQRLQKEIGKKQAVRQIQIGTFHGICIELLRKQGVRFTIADTMLARELAEQTIREFQLKISASEFLQVCSLWKLGKIQETGDPVPDTTFFYYQNLLKEKGAMDFDDILIETVKLLEEEKVPELSNFHYLLVDEFQDISPIQYRLIQLWSQSGRELFVIGDPDQSIYGFRGSDAACFSSLQKDYPHAEVIRLTENYRSTVAIVDSAMSVIEHNQGEDRVLHAFCHDGSPVRVMEASGDMAEAVFIAKEINRQVGGMDMLDTVHGFARESERSQRGFEDIGILYRTHRQARILETCLQREGIPYVISGREDFLLEPEVRGTVCFFRSILDETDLLARGFAFKLLWNLPENILTSEIYETAKETFLPLLKRSKPVKLIQKWREVMDLKENKVTDGLEHMALCYKTTEEFFDSLSLGEEGDLMRCGGKNYKADAVTLMTLHASKGLEFPLIFLAGAEEGKIPLENGKTPVDIEEERRLFYVGMTRAKEELILTHAGQPSVFLSELPQKDIIWEKVGKKQNTEEAEQMSLFDFL